MKNFFHNFKRSISDTNLYREVADGTHPLKVRYAFGLALIISIIINIVLTTTFYTRIIPSIRTAVSDNIPSDLIITLKSGELSINQPVPYMVPLALEEQTENIQNVLVINTDTTGALEIPDSYKTSILITKTTVISEKESGEIRAMPLKDFPDFTLTRDNAVTLIDSITPYAWILPVALLIPMIFFQFVGMMIIFLLAGVLLWIIHKFNSRPLSFKRAFTASMYAYTVIFIIDLILFALSVYDLGIILSALLTTLVASFFLFSKTPAVPAVIETHDTTVNPVV